MRKLVEITLKCYSAQFQSRAPRFLLSVQSLADALGWSGDGKECSVSDFVVMPNHVHVLAQFRSEGGTKACCQNWKHYTSRRINAQLRLSGHFWQAESFDHLVRSPEQFEYLRGYVARNPIVAGLGADEFRHFRR
jgi:type I restriction enzyme R subunit